MKARAWRWWAAAVMGAAAACAFVPDADGARCETDEECPAPFRCVSDPAFAGGARWVCRAGGDAGGDAGADGGTAPLVCAEALTLFPGVSGAVVHVTCEASIADDFVVAGGARARAAAVAPNGDVYVVGETVGPPHRGLVRRRVSGGSGWETVDDFAGLGAAYLGVTVSTCGDVFVTGTHGTLPLVRVLRAGAPAFETVEGAALGIDAGVRVTALKLGGLVMSGQGPSSDGGGSVYLRSGDQGRTWARVGGRPGLMPMLAWAGHDDDVFSIERQLAGGSSIFNRGVDGGTAWSKATMSASLTPWTAGASTSDGSLYLVSARYGGWTTEQSFNHGGSWGRADPASFDAGVITGTPSAVVAAAAGVLVAGSGCEQPPCATDGWLVRAANGTLAWRTVDRYRMDGGLPATATALATAPDGTVYAAGFADDPADLTHWIVRAMQCSSAP